MLKLKDILLEGPKKNPYRLVIIHHYDPDPDVIDIPKRWEPEAKKITSQYYIADIYGAYIQKKDGVITIHNTGDKKGFIINPEDTLVLVKAQGSPNKFSVGWLSYIDLLERNNVFCVNSLLSKQICNDKYLSYLYLSEGGLQQPKTVLVGNDETVLDDFDRLGAKYPVILKTTIGTQGVGVILIESEKTLLATTQIIFDLDEKIDLILQEYIPMKYDVRVHVLNNKILGAMKRPIIPGDFRSNVTQGSKPKPFKLTKLEEEESIKAAKAVGGVWVGVDFIPSADRKNKPPFIIEVNSNPGTAGIEDALKQNIALEVLKSFKDKDNWPKPVDIRRR